MALLWLNIKEDTQKLNGWYIKKHVFYLITYTREVQNIYLHLWSRNSFKEGA